LRIKTMICSLSFALGCREPQTYPSPRMLLLLAEALVDAFAVPWRNRPWRRS
jgi:hypothetical protein